MKFDYSKLKGRIIEIFGTQINFLNTIKMSEVTFIKTMKGKRFFNQCEIIKILDSLNLERENINDYFFTSKS